jgi:hypothetical protein
MAAPGYLLRPQGQQGMFIKNVCVMLRLRPRQADEGDDTHPDVVGIDPMAKALSARTWTSPVGDQGKP